MEAPQIKIETIREYKGHDAIAKPIAIILSPFYIMNGKVGIEKLQQDLAGCSQTINTRIEIDSEQARETGEKKWILANDAPPNAQIQIELEGQVFKSSTFEFQNGYKYALADMRAISSDKNLSDLLSRKSGSVDAMITCTNCENFEIQTLNKNLVKTRNIAINLAEIKEQGIASNSLIQPSSTLENERKKLEDERRQLTDERRKLEEEKKQPIQAVTSVNNKRLALVIGNTSYKIRPLVNPRNDADDVSKVLKSTGFDVIDLRDASLSQMRSATRQFGEKLMSNDVGLVYYSGHGIEVNGRNYLIPVNADIKHSDEVADQALDVSLILAKMDSAKKGVNILIVDACRDDPFGRSFRSSTRGLASMDAPQGTIIAYATAPGTVAADGIGRNSPYTKHLVRAMQMPNTPIELMFKEVRRSVREETKNTQTPWENTSLSGDFYFSVKK